jgi:hypothetical protein
MLRGKAPLVTSSTGYSLIHTWTTSLSEVQLVLLPELTMFLTTAKIVFLQNIFPLMAQKGHQATERLMIVRKTMSNGTHSFSVGLLHKGNRKRTQGIAPDNRMGKQHLDHLIRISHGYDVWHLP